MDSEQLREPFEAWMETRGWAGAQTMEWDGARYAFDAVHNRWVAYLAAHNAAVEAAAKVCETAPCWKGDGWILYDAAALIRALKAGE